MNKASLANRHEFLLCASAQLTRNTVLCPFPRIVGSLGEGMNIEQTGQDFEWALQTEGPRVGGRGSKSIGVKVSEI